jgi:hypothetical protein
MQKAKTKSMTRSFTRFMSRKVGNNLNKQTLLNHWRIYQNGGRLAVLAAINPKPAITNNVFPPSMPKSACDKIKTYQDDRETSGYIFIDLKDGYVFGDGYSTTADCLNVKSAIAAMRTVKAI